MYLQNTITYSKICAGDQIKYSRTVACNVSKDHLFHRVINHLISSNDWICISYPVVQLEGEVGRSLLLSSALFGNQSNITEIGACVFNGILRNIFRS